MPDTSMQLANTHRFARRCRYKTRADQVEVGDSIDLVVIGNAAVAIAEAELGADVELSAGAGPIAAERTARGPTVPRNGQAISRQCADVSTGAGAS